MTRRTMRSLLRVWMRINRQDRYGRAGFVLPTVVMVLLVVVLLTITIMLRSMDRAKMAQYRRVDEQVLQAATPALDRAKAKIERLLELAETEQPRPLGTPDDDKLDTIIGGDDFTFGGEKRLKVQFGTNEITTAWRFETDTNNDGYPDTYNLYGIFYHRPVSDKERTPLDARTLPMAEIGSDIDPECAQVLGMGKDAKSLAGKWNWESRGGKVKKSFFVYTTTAPMSTQGAPGTSALEYEQDVIRISLNNNAVLYDGTVEVAPSPEFRLNGRIVANGNLMVTPLGNPVQPLKFYLVSGENSCFYNDPQNSKIIIGGNVFNGTIEKNTNSPVALDLYKGKTGQGSTTIDQTNESVSDAFDKVGHNDNAYEQRIAELISTWKIKNPTADDNTFSTKDPSTLIRSVGRDKALEIYFRDRTRRVPFAEVAEGGDPFVNVPDPIFGEGDQLRPDNRWARPRSSLTDAGKDLTGLTLNKDQLLAVKPSDVNTEYLIGDRVKAGNNLPALLLDDSTPPKFITAKQTFGVWSDDKGIATTEPRERQTQVTPLPGVGAVDRDGFWEGAAAQLPQSPEEGFGGLRVITGAGVYDRTLSFLPPRTLEDLTSLYDDPTTTTVTEQYPIVWPDTMPMSPAIGMKPYDSDPTSPNFNQWSTLPTPFPTGNDKFARGDLRMRATAVYHYADQYNLVADAEKKPSPGRQTPIACVSSYYDPTNSTTAKNINGLPWNSDPNGRSNNGIVYPATALTSVTASLSSTTGIITGTPTELVEQANYVFPDGRFANQPLRDALTSGNSSLATMTLAQQSAIDSTQCALDIISATPPTPSDTVIPHGAIREASLLDARQIKAITLDNASTKVDETFTLSSPLTETEKANLGDKPKYDLPLEQRQPLELRVTVLDLDQLRKKAFAQTSAKGPTGEYLLPLSGIIYASRDDALPDWSNRDEKAGTTGGKIDEIKRNLISRTDFKLDPSRSPDGIMLINGPNLARKDNAGTQNQKIERGLTLATNLPVYIQGDFNLHTQEEFTSANKLADDWANFYGRTGRNKAFACTTIDNSNCTSPGDEWRPVTILADAISVLSDNFRLGYRNEGDFDLRSNNSGAIAGYDWNQDGDTSDTVTEADLKLDLNGDGDQTDTFNENQLTARMVRLINGFYENNFVTNGLSSGGFAFNKTAPKDLGIRLGTKTGTEVQLDDNYYKSGYSDTDKNANSSYFNNFVTPIQRRGTFPEYLMEVCLKPMASACGPDDWRVAVDSNGDKVVQDTELKEASKAIGATVGNLLFGTTALPVVDPDYQRYPRRVAFARYTTAGTNKDKLYLDDTKLPVALGINTTVGCYSYSSGASDPIVNLPITVNGGASPTACTKGFPPAKANALWFRTTTATTSTGSTGIPSSASGTWKYNAVAANRLYYSNELVGTSNVGTYQQPLLVPVLQIYATDNSPQAGEPTGAKLATELRWMPRAKSTTFNMVMAVGDIPARPGETNGGLQNLPRLQENWEGTSNQNQKMMGSFMQLFRSAYATAPYLPVRNPVDNASFFGYTATRYRGAGGGRTPYQGPPTRQWGFDVGLLSQYPDLFSSLFTTPIKSETGERKDATEEYFRQVSRDDEWVKGLLCAKLGAGGNAVTVGRPADCTAYGG
ncbi:MAG: hormogonium polysaccharide biosynthesis protein HpsA [Planktothrix agardhii LY1]|nr:hormogonium polysaccharide biosynthesis protein HpsA [Planktothrix agardhii LY1]